MIAGAPPIGFQYSSEGALTAIFAPRFGGGTREVTHLAYRTEQISGDFRWFASGPPSGQARLLKAIFYPQKLLRIQQDMQQQEGMGYWFGDPDSYFIPSDSSSTYGMLAHVRDQRGMILSANGARRRRDLRERRADTRT